MPQVTTEVVVVRIYFAHVLASSLLLERCPEKHTQISYSEKFSRASTVTAVFASHLTQ